MKELFRGVWICPGLFDYTLKELLKLNFGNEEKLKVEYELIFHFPLLALQIFIFIF